MNKNFLKAISWFSLIALLFSFSASPYLIARQARVDSLAIQVAQTRQLIEERGQLVDSLAFYKDAVQFRYKVMKGRRYVEVHDLARERWIFHYRIAAVDEDRPGLDTIFVGKQIVKY